MLKNSPAAKGGLAEGDEVTAIDGKPIATFDPDMIESRFDEAKAGDKATFDVQRAGKKKSLKVTLQEIL